jgi:malate dehydrogenase (oxaloacetate-decarboxylating)(NADP+)
MKIAAVQALATLAKEDVPDSVLRAYGGKRIEFGSEYLIPKPFDPRVLLWESTAVAKAAIDSGVARVPIADFEAYRDSLEARLGKSREVMRFFIHRAKVSPGRIVFPEGEEVKIQRAAHILVEEKIARPILLGSGRHHPPARRLRARPRGHRDREPVEGLPARRLAAGALRPPPEEGLS